jgi:hypothetical protein
MEPLAPHPRDTGAETASSLGVDSLWRLLDGDSDDLPDPLVGRDIGGVRIVGMIAEGGMGRVYEGRQEKPSRTVAVKVLRPGLTSREVLRRFANEAEILGRLRHPAIAQIHAAGTFALVGAHVPYFVMEHVPGAVPITRHVRDRALNLDERLDLFDAVVDAVAYGHSRSVIHRDLKPGNIVVDEEGRPKVIDFGVARELGREDGTALTRLGQVLGTLQAMSPEQVNADTGEVDARSDVYSLGVVLYELLVDKPPYDLREKPLLEAAKIIRERKPAPPCLLRRDVPRAVSHVTERCLAKDPAARFRTAGELRAALAAARVVNARPHTVLLRVAGAGALAGCAALVWLWPRGVQTRPSPVAAPPAVASSEESGRGVGFAATPMTSYRFSGIDEAAPFLVEASGVRIYREWQDPPEVYWGPTRNGREGRLVYRFPFPRPTRTARLVATAPCWDFRNEPGGIGRGAAAIEVSADGLDWQTLRDGLDPPAWGTAWNIDEQLPEAACGTTTIWVRVRMLVEDSPNMAYTTAQFGRGAATGTKVVFAVTATD